ncbi:MAG: hypothetical protein WC043_06920 [Pseudobdellovibrionaceae bacterium]
MDFSHIELPDYLPIRAIFDLVPHSPRHIQKRAIDPVNGIPQQLYRLFPETDPDFLAAVFLDDLNLTPIFCERDYYSFVVPAPVLDHLDTLREAAQSGLRDDSSLLLRRYMMLRHTKILEQDNAVPVTDDFFKASHVLSKRERDIDHIVGVTGNETCEIRLIEAFAAARTTLEPLEKTVPDRLKDFVYSGLRDSAPIRSAYQVMIHLTADDPASDTIDMCGRQLDFALDVQNNWGDEDSLVAAALLHDPYRRKFMTREWPGTPDGVSGDVCEFLKEKFDRRHRKPKTSPSSHLRILDAAEALEQLERSNTRVKDVSEDQLREIILNGEGYSFFEGQVLYWNDDDHGAARLVEAFLADPVLASHIKPATIARASEAVSTKRVFLDRCTELQALHQPRSDSGSAQPAFV